MPRTDAPQGLNHSYYNPEEPLDFHSSRRSKPEKNRRNRSLGDDNMSGRRPSHKSYHHGPNDPRGRSLPERNSRSRPSSPDPKYRSSRSNPTPYVRSGAHHSQPREADHVYGRNRDKDRSHDHGRDRDRDRDRDRVRDHGHPRRRNTMPEAKPKKPSFWSDPTVQTIAGSFISAGTQAFLQHHNQEGKWLGKKGAGAVATTFSTVIANHLSKGKDNNKKK